MGNTEENKLCLYSVPVCATLTKMLENWSPTCRVLHKRASYFWDLADRRRCLDLQVKNSLGR